MPSANYLKLKEAVEQKKQVTASYDGHPREFCPHALGFARDQREQVLVYQFAGASSKGPIKLQPEEDRWRCMEVSKLQRVELRDGPWHTAPNHSRPQTCVADVRYETN